MTNLETKFFFSLWEISGADPEIKRGVSIFPKLSLSWGSGGAVSPPVGPGQNLGEAQGAKAPEAPRISSLFYPTNTFKIVF